MEAATRAHASGLMHGPIGMGYPTMPVAPRRAPAILFPVSFEASTLSQVGALLNLVDAHLEVLELERALGHCFG